MQMLGRGDQKDQTLCEENTVPGFADDSTEMGVHGWIADGEMPTSRFRYHRGTFDR
jgi:hypothetical protein